MSYRSTRICFLSILSAYPKADHAKEKNTGMCLGRKPYAGQNEKGVRELMAIWGMMDVCGVGQQGHMYTWKPRCGLPYRTYVGCLL